LPTGILSWIAPTLFYDEGEMLKTAGMDVVVMVRLLKYGEWSNTCFDRHILGEAFQQLCAGSGEALGIILRLLSCASCSLCH
jgi:hypothetical protein